MPGARRRAARLSLFPLALIPLACATAPRRGADGGTTDAPLRRCEPAYRLLTETFGMAAEISPDTIADWRTQLMLPGCRVTAAGSTVEAPEDQQADSFFTAVRAAGWTRTPDPRDMPRESALRFRMGDVDCFFNRYLGIMIGSPAEMRVNGAYRGPVGADRFNVLAQCVEALPAAP